MRGMIEPNDYIRRALNKFPEKTVYRRAEKKKKSSYSGLFTAQKWSLFITYADRPYMASILYLHGKPGATSGS